MRIWGILAMLLATPGCRDGTATADPEPDCIRDMDCGALQACRNGQCVADEKPVNELTQTEPPPPTAYRGGPGQWGLFAGSAPSEEPELLWEQPLGAAVSAAPVIAEVAGEQWAVVGTHHGRLVGVVVHGQSPERAGSMALDTWLSGIIWGTAAIADGIAYVGADDDTLHAVQLATGAAVFHLRVGDCEPPRAPGPMGSLCDVDGGPTLGPVLDGRADLYFGANGIYRATRSGTLVFHTPVIAALPEPKKTGKNAKKRRAKDRQHKPGKSSQSKKNVDAKKTTSGGSKPVDFLRRTHVYATPLVTPSGDVFVGTQGSGLLALAPDGRERWRVPLRGDVDGSPVLTDNGLVVVGDDGGQITAFDQAGNQRWQVKTEGSVQSALALGRRGEVIVATTAGQLLAIGPGGNRRFTRELDVPIYSSPRVDAAGTILVVSEDGMLHAVTPRGKLQWQLQLPNRVDGAVALTPAGVVVVADVDGVMAAYGPK